LPKFDSFSDLLQGGFGYFDNIFFANGCDWSKILFLFNVAITRKKIEAGLDSAIFQRWSWYNNFRHPVFCIADPLTIGLYNIPLDGTRGTAQRYT
jgi:hypothetical protein